MNENDPRARDQYTVTFSSNRLLLAVCSLLLLMVLCTMLGIRIERFQQRQALILEARAGLEPALPPTLVAAPPAAPVRPTVVEHRTPIRQSASTKPSRLVDLPPQTSAPAAKPARTISAADLPDTIPAPTPILLAKAAEPAPAAKPKPAAAPAATPAAAPSSGFVVQVASSRDRDLANQRAHLLNGQGVPAFVESADLGSKGVWYRVLAGTFRSKTEANAILAKLQTSPQFEASFVRTY